MGEELLGLQYFVFDLLVRTLHFVATVILEILVS